MNSYFLRPGSILLVWLFTISGVIGIATPRFSEWFLNLTPLNLLVLFGVLLLNIRKLEKRSLMALLVPFLVGFVSESLGVNFGLIFGDYTYGETLGYKVFGVPLMICVNWTILIAVTSDVASRFAKNIVLRALLGSMLMTLLDFAIEISAPRFDFWEFENGIVPLQNYIGWLVTAFVAQVGYVLVSRVKTDTIVSWHILFSLSLFFGIFLFL